MAPPIFIRFSSLSSWWWEGPSRGGRNELPLLLPLPSTRRFFLFFLFSLFSSLEATPITEIEGGKEGEEEEEEDDEEEEKVEGEEEEEGDGVLESGYEKA